MGLPSVAIIPGRQRDRPVRIGVRALITLLSVDHKMPLEQISQLFGDLYGHDLNSGTILDILERGSIQAAPLEAVAMARLRETDVVHFDETGLRVAGKLYWLHTASTSDHTHLFVHPKRGQEALTSPASVLNDFTGVAVHDCWSPYFKFTKARHVLCGAHLLRELNGLKEGGSRWAAAMHQFWLDLYQRSRPITAVDEVQKPYQTLLEQADREEPLLNRVRGGNPSKRRGATSWTACAPTKTGFSPLPWRPGSRSRITKRNGTCALPRLSSRSAVVFAPLKGLASMPAFRLSSPPFANKASASLLGYASYSRPRCYNSMRW